MENHLLRAYKKKIKNKQTITNRLKNIVKVGLDLSFIYS